MFLDKILIEKAKLSQQNAAFIELLVSLNQPYVDSKKSKISESNLIISVELYSIKNRSCPLLFEFKKGIDDDSDRISLFFLIPKSERRINAFYYENIGSEEGFNFYWDFVSQILKSQIKRVDSLKEGEIYSSKLTCSEVSFGEDTTELMPFYGKFKTKWLWLKYKFDTQINSFEPWIHSSPH